MISASALDVRLFPKSWGAEFVRAGEVRFRLWSPSSEHMQLRLEGVVTPMTSMADGWFELVATAVPPGATYSFILPDGTEIADPAARAQYSDVHGPSLIIDPTAFAWRDETWNGRPWHEACIYELHVATFTSEGTFAAAQAKIDHLVDLGITAVEIMPVAQFGGERGWGYDGVLIYAPHRAYGSPEQMKAFVDAAHARGLMVLLDVVYNHFGPDGNYLPRMAPEFFNPSRRTPWGAAIAYERRPVRDFFIENALYWLDEFHLDGLRLDAIDQIKDPDSSPSILEEMAGRVRASFPNRHVHLTTEDNRNITALHERARDGRPALFTAEWNDDFHTAAHVFATGETAGYFRDFAEAPLAKLARALTEGFAYQGEASAYRDGAPRGEPSRHLAPMAFVNFLQNHDQIGNRTFGERISTLVEPALRQCLTAILILSPAIPLIFMGEEWDEDNPFLFFTDFHGELAEAVRNGRRREFAEFVGEIDDIPDPNGIATFTASKIDWSKRGRDPYRRHLSYVRHLLRLRQTHVVPLLAEMRAACGKILTTEKDQLAIDWTVANASLALRANLSRTELVCPPYQGRVFFSQALPEQAGATLPPMSLLFAVNGTPTYDKPQ